MVILNIPVQIAPEYDERILERLIKKAKEKGCDSLFIRILENKPLYPINHTDHEIEEFGQRIKFCGNSNMYGIKQGHIGYILGYVPPKEGIRERGWHEVVFPYVAHDGTPCEMVNGMQIEFEIEFDN